MEKKKRYIIKRIRKSKYFALYLYMLLVLLLLTSVASYAWFNLSRNPQVSNMNMYITSAAGLELSNDPGAETWTDYLDIYSTRELQKFQGPNTKKPFLRQVSWSDSEDSFYAPLYGYDGRLMTVLSWFALNDDDHANKADASNYYIKATFYARSGQSTTVRLSEPAERNQQGIQGAGTYVRGYPDNTGKGPEVAVRLGMKMTYVDKSGDVLSETSPMFIYEPNCNAHADGTITVDAKDYVPAYSIHQPEGRQDAELVDRERLILQNFSFGSQNGEFITNPSLFQLNPGDIVKIELYIWLEGQDVDCSNLMSAVPDGADLTNLTEEQEEYYLNNYRRIDANLQFAGSTEDQSGMTPIE